MKQIRIRCPVCGMVGWQNTFNRPHELEVLVQEKLKGKGQEGKWLWTRHLDPVGFGSRALKLLLVAKLREVANRLEREAMTRISVSGFETMVHSVLGMSVSSCNIRLIDLKSQLIRPGADRLVRSSLSSLQSP